MKITELASPIRLYWDIGPAAGVDAAVCRRIAREVVASKFLSIQITETAPFLSDACLSVLDVFKNQMIAVSLVASSQALDAAMLEHLKTVQVKIAFIPVAEMAYIDAIPMIARQTANRPVIGVSFPVTRSNVHELPRVLAFCIDNHIEHLLLPMQRLMTAEPYFYITSDERKALSAQLERFALPAWLKLTIHDPFLWRVFFPKVEFPNGGCQAANTMLYVSPEADAYPCPTLAVKIGNLLTSSFKDILSSDVKQGIRAEIRKVPLECRQCGNLSECAGGCRGRAYAQTGSLHAADPSCRTDFAKSVL